MPPMHELRQDAAEGASFIIKAGIYPTFELRNLAQSVKAGGGRLTITSAGNLSFMDRRALVQDAAEVITFEF